MIVTTKSKSPNMILLKKKNHCLDLNCFALLAIAKKREKNSADSMQNCLCITAQYSTCLLRPSILQTISLEYGCSSTYLNKAVCGSNRSLKKSKHMQTYIASRSQLIPPFNKDRTLLFFYHSSLQMHTTGLLFFLSSANGKGGGNQCIGKCHPGPSSS